MIKHTMLTLLMLLTMTLASGCVTIVDATSDGPVDTDPTKRSFGGYIDDQEIETIVAVNIKKSHPDLNKGHVRVTSYNGQVLLTGQVFTQELRDIASKVAHKVDRVRQVYNELQISPKAGFLSRADDKWIKTKIKTRLIADKLVSASKVKVVVEENTVYLMGLLTSLQAERATQIVRKTKGVKKVVRAIEYIEPK